MLFIQRGTSSRGVRITETIHIGLAPSLNGHLSIICNRRINNTRKMNYCQTLENRSSVPPNPPAGLGGAFEVVVVVVVVVIVVETGAALAQPPKSSSAATVGAGFELAAGEAGAPQPAPMSLAVSVSGTFIMVELDGAGAAGSEVLHALPPHGSMLGIMLATEAVDVEVTGFGTGAGTGAGAGLLRLKADFSSC